MAQAYISGDHEVRLPVSQAKTAISQMVDWEIAKFGEHKNLGVDGMAVIAEQYLHDTKVIIKHNATVNDIKEELAAGNPVIIPAAGQLLGNPYFKTPGPIYHVFVIKGFENNQFIVNENGTSRGLSYHYTVATIETAWHDWQDNQPISQTDRALLVIEKN